MKIGLHFRITRIGCQCTPAPDGKMQGEVDPGDQHEKYRDGFDHRAVKIAYALIVGGKSADGHGAKGMANCVKGAHTGEPVSDTTRNGHAEVDIP